MDETPRASWLQADSYSARYSRAGNPSCTYQVVRQKDTRATGFEQPQLWFASEAEARRPFSNMAAGRLPRRAVPAQVRRRRRLKCPACIRWCGGPGLRGCGVWEFANSHDKPATAALRVRGVVVADLTSDKERGGRLRSVFSLAAEGSAEQRDRCLHDSEVRASRCREMSARDCV